MEEKKITSATLAEAQTWIGRSCTCYDSDGDRAKEFTIGSVDQDHDDDVVVRSKQSIACWFLANGDYIVLEPETSPSLKSLRAQRAELDEQIEDLERVAAETEGLPEGWRWPDPKRKYHATGPGDSRIDASMYINRGHTADVMITGVRGTDADLPFDVLAAIVDAYRANNPGA